MAAGARERRRHVSTPRTFTRDMDGWWRRGPFLGYLARELTCIAVGAYGLLLLTGLLRLADGEAAFGRWLAVMRSTPALVVQSLLLAGLAWHAITWFLILPRTIPPVIVAGRRVPSHAIRAAGLAVALASAILVAFLGARLLGS